MLNKKLLHTQKQYILFGNGISGKLGCSNNVKEPQACFKNEVTPSSNSQPF